MQLDGQSNTKQPLKTFLDKENTMNFKEYEDAAAKTAIYPGRDVGDGRSVLGLAYVALKMNGEAGEFAEHIGKAMRDEKFGRGEDLSYLKRQLLIKEIGDVLWYLAAAAHELGTTLDEVAAINVDKLSKRAAEGKLGGSGDER